MASPASTRLNEALLRQDLDGVRMALADGASPDGDKTPIGERQWRISNPVEFVIRKHMLRPYLDALLDAGAALVREPERTSYVPMAPLDWALAVGNKQAVEAVLDRRAARDIRGPEWVRCFDAKKPHLWLRRLHEHGARPDPATLNKLLSRAIGGGHVRALQFLADNFHLEAGMIVDKDIIAGAALNPQVYAVFLERVLEVVPVALQQLHATGIGVLPLVFGGSHKLSRSKVETLLRIPQLAPERSRQWQGSGIVQVLLENYNSREHYGTLVEHGLEFPVIFPAEDREAYFERIAPAMVKNVKGNASPGFQEAWLNRVWVDAQSSFLRQSTPASPAPSLRRF